jgi:uncharacterized caspase-like protein/flagellar biosynthesis regulator FlaF
MQQSIRSSVSFLLNRIHPHGFLSLRWLPATAVCIALLGCGTGENKPEAPQAQDVDKLMIVDCLLPGQQRKLGSQLSYMSQRRPVKVSASECEIRGGEYVAFDRADFRTSLNVWMPEAQAGNAEAQNYVGQIYEKGMGLPPDYGVAAYWYQKAADQGYGPAQINLGHLYEKGLGVAIDPVQALNWYRKASGIKDDSLQLASSVETAKVSQQELASLKLQVDSERQKAQTYKSQLTGLQTDLSKNQQQVSALKQEEEATRAQLNAMLEGASDPQDKMIAELESQLQSKQNLLAMQNKRVADLQAQSNQVDQRLRTSVASISAYDQTGGAPTIELIDPAMTMTRGVRGVTLAAEEKTRDLVGKIAAPAGVKSFFVNGEPGSIDEYNLFWVSLPIKKQVTPVELVAIDKNNREIKMAFSIFADKKAPAAAPQVQGDDLKLGSYHALIIGNNNYQHVPKLMTAVNDAKATERVLREQYGFKTKLLLDANRYQILLALNELRQTLTENDNLIIYYAGHGELDEINNRGYWLPVDADRENSVNWISNVAITDQVNAMQAKHVMVIADSCYAGTLSAQTLGRASDDLTPALQREWIEAMSAVRARTVLTSGGTKPVLDLGGGEHSIFAQALLQTLEDNHSVLEGHRLYTEVLRKMRVKLARINQTQTPDYAPIQHAGHEAGEFFLSARS